MDTSLTSRYRQLQTDGGIYELLVQGITDYAVYLLSPQGIISSWNPGAERFKGYKAGEVIGRHFAQFYTAEDRLTELPRRALEEAIANGRFEGEGWRVRKDGTRFWAYVVIDRIIDANGQLAGFAKITRDLTERRAADEALKNTRQQLQMLIDGVSDYAIYMLDVDGNVVTWNTGAERIKGYTADEIIGHHFGAFYTAEDLQNDLPTRALEAAAEHGRFEREGWRVRKDGSQFWASIVIDAVHDKSGKLMGFAKITRDITEKRQAQLELEQARETLFQAQKMDAIGQLTGGVAHDFNNLLTVATGSLELLRARLPDDARARSLLDNALHGIRRGTTLTQRMLAFARRQQLTLQPVDLPQLIAGMSDLLERSIGPSIQIEMRIPLKLPRVIADTNQLELALLNLFVNARDAMSQGGLVILSARPITIKAGENPALIAGNYVCVTVKDSGTGMDAATLARAREPFFTTKGIGKGTGLGLPMVLSVAQQFGGWFNLESELNAGTSAQIYLRVATTTPAQEPVEVIKPQTVANLAIKVLVVDDDMLVLSSTVFMLEDAGHTVVEATSGKRALEILAAHPDIQLVLTDHAMPTMTGRELIIRIQTEFPDKAIILASGYAELGLDELDEKIVRLAKPYGFDALNSAVACAYQSRFN